MWIQHFDHNIKSLKKIVCKSNQQLLMSRQILNTFDVVPNISFQQCTFQPLSIVLLVHFILRLLKRFYSKKAIILIIGKPLIPVFIPKQLIHLYYNFFIIMRHWKIQFSNQKFIFLHFSFSLSVCSLSYYVFHFICLSLFLSDFFCLQHFHQSW